MDLAKHSTNYATDATSHHSLSRVEAHRMWIARSSQDNSPAERLSPRKQARGITIQN